MNAGSWKWRSRRSRTRNRWRWAAWAFEHLEARTLLSVSPAEQYFVYALNRARNDPVAYRAERGLSVDLSSVPRRAPLAINNLLMNSSEFKSTEMAASNYFGHTSAVTGQTPNELVRRTGYALPSSVPAGGLTWLIGATGNQVESLAAGFSTADAALDALIVDAGVDPPGHRIHLLGIDAFNATAREIGVGYAFNSAATYRWYWAIHATLSTDTGPYLTGVTFADGNANNRFNEGEGLGGVTITATGSQGTFTTTSISAGGWSLKVPTGQYVITASGGGFSGTSSAPITVGVANMAVDFISGKANAWVNFTTPTTFTPTSAVTIQGVEFGTTELGYAFRQSGQVRQITFNNQNTSPSLPGGGWTARGVWPIAGGYQVFWRGANNAFATWSLNSSGGYVSGQALTTAQVRQLESQLNFDLDQNGTIGAPASAFTPTPSVTINGVEFGTTELGYAFRQSGQVRQITFNNQNTSPSLPGGGWTVRGVWSIAGGYQVFWRGANNAFATWSLNSSGGYVSGQSLTAAQVAPLETQINFDLDQNGTIGVPASAFTPTPGVTINGVEFGTTPLGYAFRQSGQVRQITFNNQNTSPSLPGGGWTARGVWPIAGGYQVFWRGANNAFATWSLNSSGGYVSGQALTTAQVRQLESQLNFDLDQNGAVG